MSYYCNRLKNIGPATAGSAGPVPAPLFNQRNALDGQFYLQRMVP